MKIPQLKKKPELNNIATLVNQAKDTVLKSVI